MADKPIKLLKTANGESFYPRVATGNEKGTPFDGEEGVKLIDKVEQLQTSVENLVPYIGATKDINIGNHMFTVGNENSGYVQTVPGSIALKNPIGTLNIGTYSLSVNGTTIYWPTVSADPNGKYFALKSDITSHAGIDKVGTVTKVNGTSPDSNGNVQLNIPTVNNGLLTIQRNGANVATFTANQSGDTLANISVPTELAQLGGRTFSNITSRGEEYLEWGGPAKVGDISPVGMAISSEHNANRIAFINPDALKFEYSSDGGSTWTDYPITGDGTEQKTRFCTKNVDYRIGRPDDSTNLIANKSKTRITITGTDGTKQYVYSALKKMLIYVSTATALSLLVERRTGANYESNGAWETVGTYQLAGWSGWNDIPLDFALGGDLNQKSNYWQMRLTITCTTVNSNYPKGAAVLGLRLFGTTSWFPPSTLAETGHLYSFDMYQNAIFPAVVSATTFMENNKVLSDKYLGKTAQASDSAKLNGQSASYYLNYNNLTNKPSAYQLPTATSTVLGGVKSATTGTTANRDYNVQVKSDGTMKVNVPWTDTNTDTHYTAHLYVGAKDAQSNAATTNGNTYIKLEEHGALRSQHNIVGSGYTTVTSDATGKITISSTSPTSYTDDDIQGVGQDAFNAAKQYVDEKPGINKVGTVTKVNGTSPDSNGNVTITIPSAVTETTVSNWGFTKNKGTVTELKVNGLSKAPDTNGTVDVGNVCTYTNTQVDTKIDAASQKMVSIIYDDLVTARNSKDLVPGMNYRITDYTAVIRPGSVTEKSAGHQFDLIVTADGPDTLNENARVILHEGDTYFKDCDLNSWRLKYCLDNDRSRFYWAYEKGKGVIYWMEDEFHNQVPYDFKNIMFKRYKVNTVGKNTPVSFDSFFNGTGNLSLTDCISPVKTSTIGDVASDTSIWCYTFCTFENNDPTIPLDASLNLFPDGIVAETPRLLSFLHAFDNVIEPLIVCSPSIETTKKNYQRLNNIVFMKYDKDTSVDTKDDFRVYGNRFSSSSQNITLGRKCYYNTFNGNNLGLMVGYGCAENTFTTCGNTAIAYNCSGNIFNSRFGYNLVFNNCKNNSFGMKCQYLELGENSSFNTFEDDISYVRLVADATGTEPLQYVTVSKGVKGTGSGAGMLHLSQPRGLTHTVTYRRVQSETIDV